LASAGLRSRQQDGLVGYAEDCFEQIAQDFAVSAVVSARKRLRNSAFGIERGKSSLPAPVWAGTASHNDAHLETVDVSEQNRHGLRMPVQWVKQGKPGFRVMRHDRRGRVRLHGDDIVVLPSGRSTRVERIFHHYGI